MHDRSIDEEEGFLNFEVVRLWWMSTHRRDYFQVILILCQNNFFPDGHDSVVLRPLSLSSFRSSCLDRLAWYKAGRRSSRVCAIPGTLSTLQSMVRSKFGFQI